MYCRRRGDQNRRYCTRSSGVDSVRNHSLSTLNNFSVVMFKTILRPNFVFRSMEHRHAPVFALKHRTLSLSPTMSVQTALIFYHPKKSKKKVYIALPRKQSPTCPRNKLLASLLSSCNKAVGSPSYSLRFRVFFFNSVESSLKRAVEEGKRAREDEKEKNSPRN